MLKATQLCLQLKEDGICTAGIPCFSFVFLNAGTAQRTLENPLGREELEYIQKSNTITARACLLWLLCTVRYVYFFIEQPQSSRLFIFPYLEHVVKQLRRFMGVYKSFLYLGLIYIYICLKLKFDQSAFYPTNQFAIMLSWMGRYGHFTSKGSMCIGTTILGLISLQ